MCEEMAPSISTFYLRFLPIFFFPLRRKARSIQCLKTIRKKISIPMEEYVLENAPVIKILTEL